MAALPPENTARYRVHYTVGDEQHTMEIRSAARPSALGTLVAHFLSELDSAIGAMVVDFVEWAPSGSVFFNPVVTGIEGSSFGTGTITGDVRAWAFNFIGRSTGGRRVRIMVFGAVSLGADYRFVAGENAAVDAGLQALVDAGGNILCIDGLQPVWKTYVNALVNAHWQKKLRP